MHRPRAFIPWTSSWVMHSGYIDLILVTSGLNRRRCPLHFLGGGITEDLPHNHQPPPLCSLGNPLIPTVISFVVLYLSLARTGNHQSSFVLWGFWEKGEGRVRLTGPKNVQRVTRTPARVRDGPCSEFNWSHILGLQHEKIKKDCAREPSSFKSWLF